MWQYAALAALIKGEVVISSGVGKEQGNPQTQKTSCKLGKLLTAAVLGKTVQIHSDGNLHSPKTEEF